MSASRINVSRMLPYITKIPNSVNNNFQEIVRHHLCHEFFSTSFFDWEIYRNREYDWLRKFIKVCILTMHGIWLEICNIFHEITCSIMLIEDHEVLKGKVERTFQIHDNMCSPLLEQHRGYLHTMTSEGLILFSHEYFALLQYHYSYRSISFALTYHLRAYTGPYCNFTSQLI